jgi:PKHD-type hydroxylase
MMVHIPNVLSKAQVKSLRLALDSAEWVDGNETSGAQAALAKRNLQVREHSAARRDGAQTVLDALGKSALFFSAALPLRIFPPLFNRYEAGQAFDSHVDNAVRFSGDERVRTDLSATLFLSEPEEYEGGELAIEDTYGAHEVKLPAGDLILYPASSVHQVLAIGSGARLAAFFWIQSMIRDDAQRALLLNLDSTIQNLSKRIGQGDPQIVTLTGIYHNLLRQWAET